MDYHLDLVLCPGDSLRIATRAGATAAVHGGGERALLTNSQPGWIAISVPSAAAIAAAHAEATPDIHVVIEGAAGTGWHTSRASRTHATPAPARPPPPPIPHPDQPPGFPPPDIDPEGQMTLGE